MVVLLAIVLQSWRARLVFYIGAAFLLVWAAPMAPAMARRLSSERSDDALLFFLGLGLLGLSVIAGVCEVWSWVRYRERPSNGD